MSKIVFITGSSGFIGTHILHNLITDSTITKIYALCRFDTSNIGLQKIYNAFQTYHLPTNDLSKKTIIISGDISKPELGMNTNEHATICNEVDIIYHVAAVVHHTLPYKSLVKANIESVHECLRIATSGKKKILNFISTLGASAKKDLHGMYTEEFPDNSEYCSHMGYLQSKYEAEKILSQDQASTFSNIFRLGYISGHSQTGTCLYKDNQLMLFIKSCIQLGYAPKLDRLLNLTPVDFACEIMTHSVFMNEAGHVMNLANNSNAISWGQLITWIHTYQHPIKQITFESWQVKLKENIRQNALLRLFLLYRSKQAKNRILQFGKMAPYYRTDSVKVFAQKHNIKIPKITHSYLSLLFSYLNDAGFISQESNHQGNP